MPFPVHVPARAIVYILFRETNSGNASSDSDGWVEGVYRTQGRADTEALSAARKARDAGETVKWDPDNPDADSPADWTHGWRVEKHEVRA